MPITAVTVPERNVGGRKGRLNADDIKALAEGIERGEWVSDNEQVPKRGTAHQRAGSAADRVRKEFNIVALRRVFPVEGGDPNNGPFLWALGPATSRARVRPSSRAPQVAVQ